MSKGVFVEGITVDMFRNASLEAVETLLNEGDFVDIEIPEWVSVNERLPEEGQTVLCFGEGETWDMITFEGTAKWTADNRMWKKGYATIKVNYWLPEEAIPLPDCG